MERYSRLGFVGCGNMAEALCRGVIASDLYKPGNITASDISPERRILFDSLGVRTVSDNREVTESSDAVILAVKPQHMISVLEGLAGTFRDDLLIISIAAGIRTVSIEEYSGRAPVVRVMPNTPFLLGLGASAVCAGAHADKQPVDSAVRIMQTGGIAVTTDEKSMDAVTALSGSGPAYFFYFAELFIEAARLNGLERPMAEKLLFQTIKGAAAMLTETEHSPEELREMVTSPGGTTEAALRSFSKDGIGEILTRGFTAAVRRSEELSAKED